MYVSQLGKNLMKLLHGSVSINLKQQFEWAQKITSLLI